MGKDPDKQVLGILITSAYGSCHDGAGPYSIRSQNTLHIQRNEIDQGLVYPRPELKP